VVEAAAVFALAHSLSWVPVLPTPLGVIDLAVLLGLAGVGVDPAVAGASVLLWRTATLLSLLAASVLALVLWRTGWRQRWQPRAGPGEAVLGRLAHRGLFALIAAVPSSWRDRLRRLIFEHTFSAEDPWRYAEMPYEARKAEALLEAVTQRPGVVIELGCAQGHLTTRLASAFPEAQVVGVDLSPTALESARQRTRLLGNCEFLLADAGGLHRTWGRRPPADLLVVSEVLYYLGGARRVAEAMGGGGSSARRRGPRAAAAPRQRRPVPACCRRRCPGRAACHPPPLLGPAATLHDHHSRASGLRGRAAAPAVTAAP